jgi:hypothetical protein
VSTAAIVPTVVVGARRPQVPSGGGLAAVPEVLMQLAMILMLALAQGQNGKDTKGAQPTTHDNTGVSEPESRPDNPSAATSSNSSDRAETLSPVHQTDLQGKAPKKSTAKSGKKARKSPKSMPEATPSPTPGNGSERTEGAGTPAKRTPEAKEPNMQNEEKRKTDEHH